MKIENWLLIFAVLASAGFLSASYAEQQAVVTLPLDRPFAEHNCMLFVQEPLGWIRFHCAWLWSVSDDGWDEIPPIPQDKTGEDLQVWIEENIIPLVEANPLIEPSEPESTEAETTGDQETSGTADIDEEILDDFEKCYGGLEQSFAFQQEYSFEKFVRQYLRDIGTRDKLAEECIAVGKILNYSNTAHPGLVVREPFEVETTDFETRNFPQKSITEEDFERVQQSIKYPPWYQDPYSEWTGENRGNPNPIIGNATGNLMGRDKTTAEIYAEYKAEKAAAILTDQDVANIARQAQTTLCEIAFKTSGYGHLAIDKWRTMLTDGTCDELLSEEFISKWRPGYTTLEQVREHRQQLDEDIERGRQ